MRKIGAWLSSAGAGADDLPSTLSMYIWAAVCPPQGGHSLPTTTTILHLPEVYDDQNIIPTYQVKQAVDYTTKHI
jgi:hypothetical protein